MITRWEYMQVVMVSQHELDKLGSEGWELITIAPHATAIFKRPLPPEIDVSTVAGPKTVKPGDWVS